MTSMFSVDENGSQSTRIAGRWRSLTSMGTLATLLLASLQRVPGEPVESILGEDVGLADHVLVNLGIDNAPYIRQGEWNINRTEHKWNPAMKPFVQKYLDTSDVSSQLKKTELPEDFQRQLAERRRSLGDYANWNKNPYTTGIVKIYGKADDEKSRMDITDEEAEARRKRLDYKPNGSLQKTLQQSKKLTPEKTIADQVRANLEKKNDVEKLKYFLEVLQKSPFSLDKYPAQCDSSVWNKALWALRGNEGTPQDPKHCFMGQQFNSRRMVDLYAEIQRIIYGRTDRHDHLPVLLPGDYEMLASHGLVQGKDGQVAGKKGQPALKDAKKQPTKKDKIRQEMEEQMVSKLNSGRPKGYTHQDCLGQTHCYIRNMCLHPTGERFVYMKAPNTIYHHDIHRTISYLPDGILRPIGNQDRKGMRSMDQRWREVYGHPYRRDEPYWPESQISEFVKPLYITTDGPHRWFRKIEVLNGDGKLAYPYVEYDQRSGEEEAEGYKKRIATKNISPSSGKERKDVGSKKDEPTTSTNSGDNDLHILIPRRWNGHGTMLRSLDTLWLVFTSLRRWGFLKKSYADTENFLPPVFAKKKKPIKAKSNKDKDMSAISEQAEQTEFRNTIEENNSMRAFLYYEQSLLDATSGGLTKQLRIHLLNEQNRTIYGADLDLVEKSTLEIVTGKNPLSVKTPDEHPQIRPLTKLPRGRCFSRILTGWRQMGLIDVELDFQYLFGTKAQHEVHMGIDPDALVSFRNYIYDRLGLFADTELMNRVYRRKGLAVLEKSFEGKVSIVGRVDATTVKIAILRQSYPSIKEGGRIRNVEQIKDYLVKRFRPYAGNERYIKGEAARVPFKIDILDPIKKGQESFKSMILRSLKYDVVIGYDMDSYNFLFSPEHSCLIMPFVYHRARMYNGLEMARVFRQIPHRMIYQFGVKITGHVGMATDERNPPAMILDASRKTWLSNSGFIEVFGSTRNDTKPISMADYYDTRKELSEDMVSWKRWPRADVVWSTLSVTEVGDYVGECLDYMSLNGVRFATPWNTVNLTEVEMYDVKQRVFAAKL